MATRKPLATDISQIEQVDTGVYRDTVGGGYYQGTWDNPVFMGDQYLGAGKYAMNPTPGAPPPATSPAPGPGTAGPGPRIDGPGGSNTGGFTPPFLPGGSPTVPATATSITPQAISGQTFAQASATSAGPAPAEFLGASITPDQISAYMRGRGVEPYSTSPGYWAAQWPALYQRGLQLGNPNYAFERLAAADEFGGGTAGAGSPLPRDRQPPPNAATTSNGTPYAIHSPTGQALGTIGSGDVTPYDPGVYVSHDGKFYTTDGSGGAIFLGTDGAAAIKWVAQHGTASGPGGGGTGTGGGTGGTLIPPGQTTPNLPHGYSPLGGPLDPTLNQVGQDPLSEIINAALGGIFETGGTPYGQSVIQSLSTIMNGAGNLPSTLPLRVAARDEMGQAFAGQLADARGALADRGIADEPGVSQGATATAIDRITRGLAPGYASKIADIEQHALDTANTNVMQALTLATGMSENQAANVLQAATIGSNRQSALADIALRTLDSNKDWQKFLANYGLSREELAYKIQNNDMASIQALLQQFLDSVKSTQQGFI